MTTAEIKLSDKTLTEITCKFVSETAQFTGKKYTYEHNGIMFEKVFDNTLQDIINFAIGNFKISSK